jgi:hypothetical protein
MNLLRQNNMLDLCDDDGLIDFCSSCLWGMMHTLPFDKSEFVASAMLKVIHADVWGPSPMKSREGYSYYLLLVDDFSRFT